MNLVKHFFSCCEKPFNSLQPHVQKIYIADKYVHIRAWWVSSFIPLCAVLVKKKIILSSSFDSYRNQQESDLRENHPLFDTPLFIVGRESRFREICKTIVSARYARASIDPITGKENKSKYKELG